MNSEMIRSADVLDILFENRNKEYGAYVLRREYNGRLLKAMYTIPAIVLLLFLLMSLKNNNGNERRALLTTIPEEVVLREMKIPEPEKPKPLAVLPARKVATIQNTPPVIVPPNEPVNPPPTIDQLMRETAAIGTTNQAGDAPVGDEPAPATGQPGGTGQTPAEPAPEPEQVLKFAEKMPEFPGGIDKMRRFLGRNLRVPEDAVEPGQRVRIPIRFVVGKDGAVTDVEFLDKADEVFKAEILRVMNKMPKWTPGSQNGRPVAVYFSIPFIFEVGGE